MHYKSDSSAPIYAAVAIAIMTGVGLIIRIYLAQLQHGSMIAGLAFLSQFFTILSNTFVFVIMLAIALRKNISLAWVHACVLAIVAVGIIFHALLKGYKPEPGLDTVGDLITHTFVPISAFLWWLFFSRSSNAKWGNALTSLIYPLAYCVYVLARAQSSDFYPYYFIDLSQLGWGGWLQSVAGLGIVFYLGGLLLLVWARWPLDRKPNREGP